MTAAGGMYSSATDLARFLRFQLNDGSIDGMAVLDPQSMEEMRVVPAPYAGAPAGYALGVTRHRWNRWRQAPDLFNHGGGGYGFLSDIWWAPQLGIGIAVLTNSEDHQLQGDLALSILGDLLAAPGPYHDRLLGLPDRVSAQEPSGSFQPPADLAALVESTAMDPTGDEAERWFPAVGAYGAPSWGVIDPTAPAARFWMEGGAPYFEANEDGTLERFRLVEVAPGVFLAENGETLDLSGPVPTWRSIRMVRLTGGPAPWQWAILVTAAVLAAAWLIAAAVRALRRSRSRSGATPVPAASQLWPRISATVATFLALITLTTVALIVWMPGLIDSGFLGWLQLPLVERLAMHLPLALSILGGLTLVLVVVGWLRGWWPKLVKSEYAALAVAALMVVGQLAVWHLIGWGA